MFDCMKSDEKHSIELKPHLFRLYLKAIGFKFVTVINESNDISDIDISTQKSRPLYVYQK